MELIIRLPSHTETRDKSDPSQTSQIQPSPLLAHGRFVFLKLKIKETSDSSFYKAVQLVFKNHVMWHETNHFDFM